MIIVDIVLSVLLIFGVGTGVAFSIPTATKWFSDRREDRLRIDREREKKYDLLAEALNSGDYRKLDNWLVLYGDDVSKDVQDRVKERRTEMFIEKNS